MKMAKDEGPIKLPKVMTKRWLARLSDEDLLKVDRELWRTPDYVLRGTALLRVLTQRRMRITEELERRGVIQVDY